MATERLILAPPIHNGANRVGPSGGATSGDSSIHWGLENINDTVDRLR